MSATAFQRLRREQAAKEQAKKTTKETKREKKNANKAKDAE